MSAIARRLDKLEQALVPEPLPLLVLILFRAGGAAGEPLDFEGHPRDPGEPWDAYKARVSNWHQQHRGESCVVVLKARYAK